MFAKIRAHLILIIAGTLFSAFSLASVVSFTDPYTGGWAAHGFFYLSLFLTSLGACTGIGLIARQKFLDGLYINHLAASFRQALFISIILIVSLGLQSHRILFWWVEGSLILFFIVLETFLTLK